MYLPDVNPDAAKVLVQVEVVIGLILWVGNLWVHPHALEVRVVDELG